MARLTARGMDRGKEKRIVGMARVWPWISMIAVVGTVALAPALPVRADDPIADRKEVAEQAKAIKAVVDAGGPASSVVAPAKKIVALEATFVKDFPAGSDK